MTPSIRTHKCHFVIGIAIITIEVQSVRQGSTPLLLSRDFKELTNLSIALL